MGGAGTKTFRSRDSCVLTQYSRVDGAISGSPLFDDLQQLFYGHSIVHSAKRRESDRVQRRPGSRGLADTPFRNGK